MKAEDLYAALEYIDDERLLETESPQKPARIIPFSALKPIAAAAACLLVGVIALQTLPFGEKKSASSMDNQYSVSGNQAAGDINENAKDVLPTPESAGHPNAEIAMEEEAAMAEEILATPLFSPEMLAGITEIRYSDDDILKKGDAEFEHAIQELSKLSYKEVLEDEPNSYSEDLVPWKLTIGSETHTLMANEVYIFYDDCWYKR